MRMPRFRVRTMMIAVAVVAACLGMVDRWSRLLGLAEYHRSQRVVVTMAGTCGTTGHPQTIYEAAGEVISFTKAQQLKRSNDWHEALSTKYLDAARYPWLHVEPDPPAPE